MRQHATTPEPRDISRRDAPAPSEKNLHAPATRQEEMGERRSPAQQRGRDEASVDGRPTGGRAPTESTFQGFFRKFAQKTSSGVGSPWAFAAAFLVIVIWAATGPLFDFTDTWQLVVNTGTTIVTFLMVFLIQNTQNRDAMAIHLKLDELISAMKGARTRLVDLENLSDEELEHLRQEFRRMGAAKGDDDAQVRESER